MNNKTKDIIQLFKKDLLDFITLFSLSIIVLHFTGNIIKTVYFSILLGVFIKSQKNYFWIAFFSVIIMDVGGIFHGTIKELISIGPIDFSLLILFAIACLIKVVIQANQYLPNLFSKPLKLWLLYMVFLLFTGFVVFGNEGGGKSGLRWYYEVIRLFFLIPLFFVLPKLFNKTNSVIYFANLIFIAVIINITGQFVHVLYGTPVFEILSPTQNVVQAGSLPDYSEQLVRPLWGIWINLIAFALALYYLINANNPFKHSYLLLIIFLSFSSVTISATRGYFIAFTFFLILFLFKYSVVKKSKVIKLILSIVILFSLIFILWSPFRIQLGQSFTRLETISSLAEGDITLGGTNIRGTTRHQAAMNLFYKSPIIGLGFSSTAMEGNDQHVGNQMILMSGGVIGFLIIFYFLGFIVRTIISYHKKMQIIPAYKDELLIFVYLFLSMFIIHSTSTALFGFVIYSIAYTNMFFIALVLSIINRELLDRRIEFNKYSSVLCQKQ